MLHLTVIHKHKFMAASPFLLSAVSCCPTAVCGRQELMTFPFAWSLSGLWLLIFRSQGQPFLDQRAVLGWSHEPGRVPSQPCCSWGKLKSPFVCWAQYPLTHSHPVVPSPSFHVGQHWQPSRLKESDSSRQFILAA